MAGFIVGLIVGVVGTFVFLIIGSSLMVSSQSDLENYDSVDWAVYHLDRADEILVNNGNFEDEREKIMEIAEALENEDR